MKTKWLLWATFLIAVTSLIFTLHIRRLRRLEEYRAHPVASYPLTNNRIYQIWKQVFPSDDAFSLTKLLISDDFQSFEGVVKDGDLEARWSFDILPDCPPEGISVQEVDGQQVVFSNRSPVAEFKRPRNASP